MTPFLLIAVGLALVAALYDSRTGNIPNWLTLGGIASAPLLHLFIPLARHMGRQVALGDAGYSICGGFLCAILPIALYRIDAIGGGDVKLFVAIGMMLRPLMGLEAELWGFCGAAAIAPIGLAYQGKLFRTVSNAAFLLVNPVLPKSKRREIRRDEMTWFRMGPAILVGTLVTLALHLHDR